MHVLEREKITPLLDTTKGLTRSKSMCVCERESVCACVRESENVCERESVWVWECVCECVCVYERVSEKSVCVIDSVRVCVSVCVWERESVCLWECVSECVCVYESVCVWKVRTENCC
jgi:hypothetical protein